MVRYPSDGARKVRIVIRPVIWSAHTHVNRAVSILIYRVSKHSMINILVNSNALNQVKVVYLQKAVDIGILKNN